jgi:hypothetical protein
VRRGRLTTDISVHHGYRKETVMGWLYMKSLKGHSGPRQYLDAQFTFERPDTTSKVLRSVLVGMRVYYAAVEHILPATGVRKVCAVICLVRYNPRDPEGYIFGYKDISESMGPYERDCPEPILDLLTPTDHEHARRWRDDCRANAAARRGRAKKPGPRAGQTIIFDEPLTFADGRCFDRLDVIANPRSHRTVLFRAPGSDNLYRIPNIKSRAYRLIDRSPG